SVVLVTGSSKLEAILLLSILKCDPVSCKAKCFRGTCLLLEVNKQWDHQFRSMKQVYEKQLAEMKAKLDVSERKISELEEERHRQRPEAERFGALGRERPLQEMKETKVLSEALHEMKEENKLLKQKNASMIRKKEHYECEISRLNKV
uniref:TNFAIP3 interacting protein 3 n=1 Tax=Buteo japonicus TaxID=224669 RepID=A0A8C0B1D7_9AVES